LRLSSDFAIRLNMTIRDLFKNFRPSKAAAAEIAADPLSVEYRSKAAAIEDAAPPKFARTFLLILCCLIAIGVLWSAIARVDRVVTGEGRLVTLAPSIVLQPFESSIIRQVNVRIGQTVRKDDTLVEFDPTFAKSDARQSEARLEVLTSEQRRLKSELSDVPFLNSGSSIDIEQNDILVSRKGELAARIGSINAAITKLGSEARANSSAQALYSQRINGITKIEAARRELAAQGLVARVSVYQATSERLENELQYRQRGDASLQANQEIRRLVQERDGAAAAYRREVSERMAEVSSEIESVRSKFEAARRRAELVSMQAPADAMVVDVAQASPGAIADAGRPLITLVPLNVPLEGQIGIAPSDIARVRVGDRVRIKLLPFPFQRHGIVEGSVLALAEEAVLVDQNDPKSLVYRARVRLGKIELRDVPADFKLYAGMPMTGEVVIGQRSVLSFLISPLIRTSDEAMREP
jgi:hemolysin D